MCLECWQNTPLTFTMACFARVVKFESFINLVLFASFISKKDEWSDFIDGQSWPLQL